MICGLSSFVMGRRQLVAGKERKGQWVDKENVEVAKASGKKCNCEGLSDGQGVAFGPACEFAKVEKQKASHISGMKSKVF